MKKYGLLGVIVASGILVGVIFFYDNTTNVVTHIGYKGSSKQEIISQTPYIPDFNGHSFFKVCQSRDNLPPCEEIAGVIHGIQKWYKDGALQYEDFYDHGNLLKSIAFYPNGLKNQESLYNKNAILTQENFYKDDSMNSLTKVVLYKGNDRVEKSYKHNKIYQEKKYRNNILVSRKIYNSDGLLQQLEEYSASNSDISDPFQDFFGDFNNQDRSDNTPQRKQRDMPLNNSDSMWI